MSRYKKNGELVNFFQVDREYLVANRGGLKVSLSPETSEIDFCAHLRGILMHNEFGLVIPNKDSALITIYDGVEDFLDAIRNVEVSVTIWRARGALLKTS